MPRSAFRRLIPLVLPLTALLVGVTDAAWAIRPGSQAPPRPAFDARAGDAAPVPAPVRDARAVLERRLGAEGTVSANLRTGGVRLVGDTAQLLTGRSTADPASVALDYVRAHLDAFGLDEGDLAGLQLTRRSTSPDGVTHLAWRQVVDGVPAYDSELVAAVTRDGRLVSIGGAPVHGLDIPSADPPLGPAAARGVAQRDVGVPADGDPGRIGAGAERPTSFAGGDHARLTVVAGPDGDRLAWRLTVAGRSPYVYDTVVDAASGAVLARHSLTDFAVAAKAYENHPGDSGPRSVDLTPYLYDTTSPTSLDGPYAHAYADVNDSNIADAGEEVGSDGSGNFDYTIASVAPASGQQCPSVFTADCTWDGVDGSSAAVNQSAAVTQLFWFVNNYHDWLAQPPIGFDASSHDFQGGDALIAEADDGAAKDADHVDNANMTTPADGQSPRMQMYLWSAPFPAVDGDFDPSVVYHEYTHGLSNRLVGGDGMADGLTARQSGAMGEGWSDWYAMDYLVAHGLEVNTSAPAEVVMGAYVTDDRHVGIRYNALDCPVGAPQSACPGSPTAGSGGFTFADMGRVTATGDTNHPYFEVHADGEIWSETLWDLREALGATTARGLITSGMRLAPKNPSFLDMRDAILEADLVAGGAHRQAIWSVFAARGMGWGATTASANATRGVASFATPPLAGAGVPAVSAAPPLGDGDGALEPGEAARISLALTNPGTQALTGVRATLSAGTPGVLVGEPAASYGTIAAGASAAADRPFVVTVPSSVACGTLLSLTLSVTSDQGSFTVPVAVPLESGRATATKTLSTPVTIPDDAPATGITSTLSVGTHGRIDRLRVTLAASHAWMGDLHAWLRSPAGTVVDLMENPGVGDWGSGSDLSPSTPLVFDDAAARGIQDDTAGDLTTTSGPWRPNEPLASFAGEDRAGTWTLRIVDTASPDEGSLSGWSIETDDPTCSATGPKLPVAATADATGAVGDAATLNGQVDPAGTTTQALLEYGTTTAYGTATAPQSVGPAGGMQSIAAAVTGLTPGTAYHVRALALRDGVVVAAGDDRAFVAASGQAPPTATTLTSTTTATPHPRPAVTLSRVPRVVRASRSGRVVLLFRAAPLRTRGALVLLSLRGGRRLASARFTAARSGRVTVRLKLTASARRTLRRTGSLRVRARIVLRGHVFLRTITVRRTP